MIRADSMSTIEDLYPLVLQVGGGAIGYLNSVPLL